MLQQAFLRAAALPEVKKILTVTGLDLRQAVQAEYIEINNGGVDTPFVLEPFGRNTAAATAIAALQCLKAHGEDSIMLVLPADHLVENQQAFAGSVKTACEAARRGKLVAFGVVPVSAHTGYGYIEVGDSNGDTPAGGGWLEVRRFVEKPDQERAREFLQSGRYFWNSGMYCFKPGVLLQEMRQHCPALFETAVRSFESSIDVVHAGGHCLELESRDFAAVPNESIDVAVMEKTRNIVVVPGRFAWSDIGSWSAIAAVTQKDGDGNSDSKNAIFHNSFNCFVHGGERPIGIVGLEDIIVVDAPTGLLVAHRDQAQDVRHIAARIEALLPQSPATESAKRAGAGRSGVIEAAEGFQVRRLAIEAGSRISRLDAGWPAGPWLVATGRAEVIGAGGKSTVRTIGEAYHCNSLDQEIASTGDGALTLIVVDRACDGPIP